MFSYSFISSTSSVLLDFSSVNLVVVDVNVDVDVDVDVSFAFAANNSRSCLMGQVYKNQKLLFHKILLKMYYSLLVKCIRKIFNSPRIFDIITV